MNMKRILTCSVLMLACLCSTSLAQTRAADLDAALARIEQGAKLVDEHDPQSKVVLGEAAAMLEQVIDQYEVESPRLDHALGNAYMLRGDVGRAILAYRRGEQLDPTNIELRESLEYARSKVPVAVEQAPTNRLWAILLSWRGFVPRFTLWLAFIELFFLGWAACSSKMLELLPRSAAVAGIWMLAASLVPLGMLGTEWIHNQGSAAAVITQSGVTARTGPDDEIYEPVFSDPLQSGVEARVIESRNAWTRLALGDGTTCWVPQESLELVN